MSTQRFAILSVARSGTNYFSSKIAFLPNVLFAWEPFNNVLDRWFDETDLFGSLPTATQNALRDVKLRNLSHEKFYEAAFSPKSQLALPNVAALGFKLFPNHSSRLFWKVATEPEMKVLVLERENWFDTFASLIRAYRIWAPLIWTGAPWTGTSEFGEKDLFRFDPIFFASFVQSVDSTYDGIKLILERNETKYIHLNYEQFTNSDQEISRACEFIGVTYVNYGSAVHKEITRSPYELFHDRELVEEHIKSYYPRFWRETVVEHA